MRKIDRTGEISYDKFGNKMTIIEYINANSIIVEFENGYKAKCRYEQFKNGNLNNPYNKTVLGVGYIGEGEYVPTKNKKATRVYDVWRGMLRRCYEEKRQVMFPTYKGCSVCEEWMNFQNFAKWYNENYYEIEGDIMCLDKDILVKGNKIYSPNTCIFVPNRINCAFTKSNASRGKYPIGVSFDKKSNKFRAYIDITKLKKKEMIHLGFFDTIEEAFNTYKIEKEKYIKQIADEYKNRIPKKLYKAMYNYKVEITD